MTAYDRLAPGDVAFAGWAVLQRCNGVDLDALDRFVAAYAAEEPDTPGADAVQD